MHYFHKFQLPFKNRKYSIKCEGQVIFSAHDGGYWPVNSLFMTCYFSLDVVMKLKRDPQFRPALRKPEGSIGAGWNNLAIICWHRKPEARPSFKMIRGKLRSINGGK